MREWPLAGERSVCKIERRIRDAQSEIKRKSVMGRRRVRKTQRETWRKRKRHRERELERVKDRDR